MGTKDDGGGGENWRYRMCKAPVESSPPTHQHPTFYRPDALPVTQPTMSEHGVLYTENKKHHYSSHCCMSCPQHWCSGVSVNIKSH